MTAISFFSYKGGVGRTLALTSMALRLAEFGKSVFIIDFDLEAPGVPFKLKGQINPDDIKSGLVDYIYEFSSKGRIDEIDKHVVKLPSYNPEDKDVWLMPAGKADVEDYWAKLSRINWHEMFYSDHGKGLRFFLDLKERIRKTYNPDFILIDSRTGLTELSGISLKILADEVVILFVNNEENFFGTEKVLSFLNNGKQKSENKVHLALTRIRALKTTEADYKSKFNVEYKLIDSLKKRFFQSYDAAEINVIHTDDGLQEDEQLAFSDQANQVRLTIRKEHLIFFEKIFKSKFLKEEWDEQENKIKYANRFDKALSILDPEQKISLLTELIEDDGEKWKYLLERGKAYRRIYLYEEAKNDCEKALGFNSNSFDIYLENIFLSFNFKNYNKAIKLVDDVLKNENVFKNSSDFILALVARVDALSALGRLPEALEYCNLLMQQYVDNAFIYNARADVHRRMGLLDDAMKDALKAINLSQDPVNFGTLAEIYAEQDKLDEFYHNLQIALSKGLTLSTIRIVSQFYERFRHEKRFIELLRSYNISSEDVFGFGPPTKSLDITVSTD